MSIELDQARQFAEHLLDEIGADPDDQFRVLARQFRRRDEIATRLLKREPSRLGDISNTEWLNSDVGIVI